MSESYTCWIASSLYSTGTPSLSREELKKFTTIVTLQDREPWYEGVVKGPSYLRLDIPHQGVAKDEPTKKLVRQLVNLIRDGEDENILLLCRDGVSNCGFIAIAVRGWIEGILDSEELIKRSRDELDFTTARSKEQRNQLKVLMAYAKEIELCPFIKRKKARLEVSK